MAGYSGTPLLRLITQMGFASICSFAAQASQPERSVKENVITSERDPKVRIELPKSAQYVGADRWVLYGIADCELHGFVDTDSERKIDRIYWVQFEGYVPEKPELKHQYTSPWRVAIGGVDFILDTWMRAKEEKSTSGSDLEHLSAMIAAKGYKLPAGMIYARLVYLLDEQKRKELMIIYAEDVGPTGFAVDDLREKGKAHDRWPAIEKELVERAKEKIKIVKL